MKKQLACVAVVCVVAVISFANYKLLDNPIPRADHPYVSLIH